MLCLFIEPIVEGFSHGLSPDGFALLIVLFILLIIIGCSCFGGGGFGY
ncbi:YjcZ family sporulation protein [Bacillus cereus]|nr:YjcZ family sporulation protein [Bacillus cereus]MBL3864134.1 YjcZ family sporulation protein [Bacillus cereus]HDR6770130.1 YjcZ family sporulation protein [Bacillus cereus]